MRIADMTVHSISIADPPLRSSYGMHAPYALRTILELKSEDGIVGISETHGGDAIAHAFHNLRQQIIIKKGNEETPVPFIQILDALTGSGKTVILAKTIGEISKLNPENPIIL